MLTLILLLACGGSDPAPVQTVPVGVPIPMPAVAEAPAPEAPEAADEDAYSGRFAGSGYEPHELVAMSKAELRLLRNEIFARHGRAFASEDLQQHFGSQPWYTEDPDFDESVLTEQDRAQSKLIQSFEQEDIDPSMAGEFHHGDETLMFMDQEYVELLGPGSDMYEMDHTILAYKVHGRWIVTWESNGGVEGQERTLWQLDPESKTVEQRLEMPPKQG